MKTLTYGSLKIDIDLDGKGDEIFMESLEELITEMRKDFKWRRQHPQNPSNSIETPREGIITPEGRKNDRNKGRKNDRNKRRVKK